MADITITEGDTLEVDYSLENTGDGTGTFDPHLLVQGVQEDQDTGITLNPAQTATGTLQWPTESGDAVTDALAEAVTDDTSDSITVTVEGGPPDTIVNGFETPGEWSVTNDIGAGSGIISTAEARGGSNAFAAGDGGGQPDGNDLYATYDGTEYTSAEITHYYKPSNSDFWNTAGIFREQSPGGDAIGVYFDLTSGSGDLILAERTAGSWSTLDSTPVSESITAGSYNELVVELNGDGSDVSASGVVNGTTYTTATVTTSVTSAGAMGIGQITPSNTGGLNYWDDVTIVFG